MVVRRVKHTLADGKRFYRGQHFLLRLAGQMFLLMPMLYAGMQGGVLPGPMPLAGVFLFSVFFWRRRWINSFAQTHLYMAIQSAVSTLVVFQAIGFASLFMVLAGQAAAMFKPRTGLIWVAVMYAIVLAANWHHPGDEMFAPGSRAVVVFVLMAISAIVSGSVAKASRDRERIEGLLTELNGAHAQLQRYASQAEILAAAAERERIARELHDTLGHRLTVSVVQLEGANRLIEQEPRRVAGMIETVRSQLTTGLEELRQTLLTLRGHGVNRDELLPSLQQTVDEFEKVTGIVCHRQLPEMVHASLSDEQCTAIYRIVQEALTNVQKHAGALNIWMGLEVGEDALILLVRNDGRDFDPSSGNGYGLQGMRERAARLGGSLRVTKPTEGGILVHLTLPIGDGARERAAAGPRLIEHEFESGIRVP